MCVGPTDHYFAMSGLLRVLLNVTFHLKDSQLLEIHSLSFKLHRSILLPSWATKFTNEWKKIRKFGVSHLRISSSLKRARIVESFRVTDECSASLNLTEPSELHSAKHKLTSLSWHSHESHLFTFPMDCLQILKLQLQMLNFPCAAEVAYAQQGQHRAVAWL